MTQKSSTMIHYDPNNFYYDPLWPTMVHYDPKNLYYDPLWPTMTQKISNMIHYDQFFKGTMIHYARTISIMLGNLIAVL